MNRDVPQPHPSRITPFAGHPIVVGVTPGQPELVALTAAEWAIAFGALVYFAYVDPTRVTEREFPDGTVQHSDLDPDAYDDDQWSRREQDLTHSLTATLADTAVTWQFRYLAGRADRSLTHLARAVDAAAIVVGTSAPRAGTRMHEFLDGSIATHLTHHQHRPVLVVPLSVIDWKTPLQWT
jgi:nucleotide-binding universal stress UspA family protein